MAAFSWALLGSLLVFLHALRLEACTVIELDGSGFTNNAYSLLHAVPMFLRQNGTIFLDSSNFQYKCSDDGGWHDFFSGEEDVVPWSSPKEAAAGHACARYTLQRIDELMYNTVQAKPDLLDFIGIKQVWKPRPWIQSQVEEQLKELAQLERPTIAFHIRGGDKSYKDKRMKRISTTPLDSVQTFAQAYPLVRGGTCIVIGDEHAKVTEAAKAAERHLKCKIFRTSPYWRKEGFSQEVHNKEGFDVKCGGTVKLITDMELLARSDYLVASDRTRWSRILQYMRYILYEHDRSSYVDATADHVDLFSVIRKYIRPDAFDVHHEGHHKEAKTAPPDEPVRKKKKEVKASRQQPVQEEEPSQEDEGDDEDYEDDEVVTFST